jgi:hypothetical protein
MTKKKKQEMRDAISALYGWFESQQISMEDAVPIMAYAINALLQAHGGDLKRGQDIVAQMIREKA